MRAIISTFRRSDEGAILAFWAAALAIMLGLVALSFDMGRVAVTQTELQAYADQVALAAAGELDGGSDAITRATSAAATMIADTQTFGNANNALGGASDYTLTFLSDLPANDTAAMTAITTNPADAAFARVTVNTATIDLTFGAAFAALTGNQAQNNQVAATAVAGFTQYACDVTPLMFCIPSPGFKANDNIGTMIQLRSGGQGAAWGPGDFGFLDPSKVLVDTSGPCAGKSGVNLDTCLIGAIGSVTQCFAQRGVDIEPGQKVGIEDAVFNIRFDIYKSIMNGERNDPLYAPAPNVIKGIVRATGGGGNACIGNNEAPSPDTVALPRDDCFLNSTCAGNGRVGDGNWASQRANYVTTNHGGVDPDATALTRYELYLAEIANAGGPASGQPILTGLAESGRPSCSPHQSDDPARRIVIAAGIDCTANPINGAATNVPVAEFYKVFLTEPVGQDGSSPPNVDIWVEIVGSAGGDGAGAADDGGIFRDVVQLYR